MQNKQLRSQLVSTAVSSSPVSAIGWHCLHLGDMIKGQRWGGGEVLKLDLAALPLALGKEVPLSGPVFSTALVTEIILWG